MAAHQVGASSGVHQPLSVDDILEELDRATFEATGIHLAPLVRDLIRAVIAALIEAAGEITDRAALRRALETALPGDAVALELQDVIFALRSAGFSKVEIEQYVRDQELGE